MAKNQWGLDAHYFRKELARLARDADHYTPEEMRRYLDSLSDVASNQSRYAASQPTATHPHSEAHK